ncbi:MAG: hypothetical protein PV362_01085 [Providencia heimbachae]|nr:hypothetical protein [Providencia heimbachae]
MQNMKNKLFLSQRDIKGIINKQQSQVIRHAKNKIIIDYIVSLVGKQLNIKEHYFIHNNTIKYNASEKPTGEYKQFNAADMPDNLVRLNLNIEYAEVKPLSDLTDDDAKRHGIESREKLIKKYCSIKDIKETDNVLIFNFTHTLRE